MAQPKDTSILSATDGAAFETGNPAGKSEVLLDCEHASKHIPESLDNLGLDAKTANSQAHSISRFPVISELVSNAQVEAVLFLVVVVILELIICL